MAMPERSIILMKGYPFTRKTEFAEIIAKSLKCPLLSSDDIILFPTTIYSPNLSKKNKNPFSPKKEYEAFMGICNVAIHHLDSEVFNNVVIDSPLCTPSHLLLLTIFKPPRTRIIVIECKPTNAYSWKLKFEQRSSQIGSILGRQYKTKKWEDVEKAIAEYPDYDAASVSEDVIVSKLVVDPLLDCPFGDRTGFYSSTRLFEEAVKFMITRDQGGRPDVVVYREWLHSSSSLFEGKHCGKNGHSIVPNSATVEAIQHETIDCEYCGRQVTRSNDDIGGAFCYCKNCSLTLHMECALSRGPGLYDGRRRSVLWSRKPFARCKPCTEKGKGSFDQCKKCKFDKHVHGGYDPSPCPIAIKHFDKREHFLTILFLNKDEACRCFACGESCLGDSMYLCADCGVTYHNHCAIMPRRVRNVHGGHHHHLSLKFESEEAEDYICQECQEYRDPLLWYYSCDDCPGYELHPSCVANLRILNPLISPEQWIDKEEIEATVKFNYGHIKMEESESISDFYSRVVYLIQWYGDPNREYGLFTEILQALPLKFYHIVVAIMRSEEYESMTVDQLMIYLRVYEKRIDNGEDVLIEQVLANLYATQRSSSRDNYNGGEDEKWIMNVADVSLKSVLFTDYSKQESGENWIKYWRKYWDNYWFNYQRSGYYRSQDKCKLQCSICYMFGHDPRYCWTVSNTVKITIKNKIKIRFFINRQSRQRRSITRSLATSIPRSEIERRV